MNRRLFLTSVGGGLALGAPSLLSQTAAVASTPFGFGDVEAVAEAASKKPHVQRRLKMPGRFAELSYDDYRQIRPRREKRLWLDEGRNFTVEFFHPGFLFNDAVDMALVEDGVARPLPFDPATFEYPFDETPDPGGLTYSGFRVQHPINTEEYWDEFLVFQGASYFRSIGRNDLYGLSARGLAIGTASEEGEEFPYFSKFWIERPKPGAKSLKTYALLYSASTTGAYEFVTTPGETTEMEVRATLFPRRDLKTVGVAPLTSMFLFGPNDRVGVDDFRDAVHDTDGLQMINGKGERLWRPLSNPRTLQVSSFQDDSPRGFGLRQRPRDFAYYEDAEARYDRRTSAWIEPIGDWGKGSVVLIEIPTDSEINDNIVSFWRPSEPLAAGQAHRFAYRLVWGAKRPDPAPLARIVATRAGKAPNDGDRRFVVDFEGDPLLLKGAEALAWTSRGGVGPATVAPLPQPGTVRAAFAFHPEEDQSAELRLQLRNATGVCSETWLYRWTAS